MPTTFKNAPNVDGVHSRLQKQPAGGDGHAFIRMAHRRRIGLMLSFVLAFVLAGLIPSTPATAVSTSADPSDVVIVLDFSASILNDKTNRDRFAAALGRIADRVDATTNDLVTGDATVSFVWFATTAADYPGGCTDLKFLSNPRGVVHFADCLRSVAKAYRKGPKAVAGTRLGTDTNYVKAMEGAARHVPLKAERPAVIFFTDGQHDVSGVPPALVIPARDRLFASRVPFALLPVGMGLDPAKRAKLTIGLEQLRLIREMGPCRDRAEFVWPNVEFDSADAAGEAVALALQDVTCTFTVGEPPPSPPPPLPPGPPRNVTTKPGNASAEVTWLAPAATPTSRILDYEVRCLPIDGGPPASTEAAAAESSAAVTGLTNGLNYTCDVAAVNAAGPGDRTASTTAIPYGPPLAPGKPSVEAKDQSGHATLVQAKDAIAPTSYRYECSQDGGAAWSVSKEVASSDPATDIRGLSNGLDYVCRAYGANDHGVSDASPISDSFRPCGSIFQCNPVLPVVLGVLSLLLLLGLLFVLLQWYTGRARQFVTAQVDDFPPTNLGKGPLVGFGLIRSSPGKPVTDITSDRSSSADVKIRYRGGTRFDVTSGGNSTPAVTGQEIDVTDVDGGFHALTLRASGRPTAISTPGGDADAPWDSQVQSSGVSDVDSSWD
jgi:hypothetical protein